jgi:hypothetical protein
MINHIDNFYCKISVKLSEPDLFFLILPLKKHKVIIICSSFFSFWLAHNDRGYGHLAVCGSIRCRETTR